jgi:hypothetical protein
VDDIEYYQNIHGYNDKQHKGYVDDNYREFRDTYIPHPNSHMEQKAEKPEATTGPTFKAHNYADYYEQQRLKRAEELKKNERPNTNNPRIDKKKGEGNDAEKREFSAMVEAGQGYHMEDRIKERHPREMGKYGAIEETEFYNQETKKYERTTKMNPH